MSDVPINTIICGDCLEVMRTWPDGCVQSAVTSPPYWGLRDYGIEPSVWGGDPACEHEWAEHIEPAANGILHDGGMSGQTLSGNSATRKPKHSAFCQKCGAWRGCYGLEPTPELFVEHTVTIFREVRRVLRDDGTLWLNLGDSYNAAGRDTHGTRIGAKQGTNRASANGSDAVRSTASSLKPKDLVGIPWRVALALQQPYYTGRIRDERDRVWLAAMLDAEGSVCGTEYLNGDRTKTNIYISITNTSVPIIEKCERLFPQDVKHVYEKTNGVSNRQCFRWDVERMETKALFLREVYPYLVAKRKQAIIGYTFIEMQRGLLSKKKGYLPEQQEKQSCLMSILSKLNGGEDVDLPGWVVEPPSLFEPGFYLRQDIIWHKCLSGGTVLWARTQKGAMPSTIKDLARLRPETVELWNGQAWTRVVGWNKTPRPDSPIEIELRSGQRIGCTQEHRWPTNRGLVEAKDLKVGDIIKTTTLPDTDNMGSAGLPLSVARVVGWYLAEGSRSGDTIQFSLNTDERWMSADLRRFAEYYGGSHHDHVYGNSLHVCLESKVVNAILDTYISGNGSHYKHLTNAAWQRNNAFLDDILTGYLEGDGHHRQETDEWRLGFCNNDSLACDLRTICARLGYSIRMKRTQHRSSDGKMFAGYRGRIRKANHNGDDGEIVAIRPSRARFFYDVQVEDEPHLFSLASGVLTHNSNPMPESVTDRCTKAHEYLFLLTKSPRYFYDAEAIKEPQSDLTLAKANGAPRQVGGKKTGTAGRNILANDTYVTESWVLPNGRNKRSVWTIATAPFKEAHFATFPPELVRPCIRAGTSAKGCCPQCGAPWERVMSKTRTATRPGANTKIKVPGGWDVAPGSHGTIHREGRTEATYRDASEVGNRDPGRHVTESKTIAWQPTCECGISNGEYVRPLDPVPCVIFDPFGGSGTTGMVAAQEGRNYVMIERNPKYAEMARRTRLAPVETAVPLEETKTGQLPLFGGGHA